jgi:hypothetical protein
MASCCAIDSVVAATGLTKVCPGKKVGCGPVKNRLSALSNPFVRYGSNAGSTLEVDTLD